LTKYSKIGRRGSSPNPCRESSCEEALTLVEKVDTASGIALSAHRIVIQTAQAVGIRALHCLEGSIVGSEECREGGEENACGVVEIVLRCGKGIAGCAKSVVEWTAEAIWVCAGPVVAGVEV